jgi:hypothetical protein
VYSQLSSFAEILDNNKNAKHASTQKEAAENNKNTASAMRKVQTKYLMHTKSLKRQESQDGWCGHNSVHFYSGGARFNFRQ